jgi:hypothetical protein
MSNIKINGLKPSWPMSSIKEILKTDASDAFQSPNCRLPKAEQSDYLGYGHITSPHTDKFQHPVFYPIGITDVFFRHKVV